VIRFEIRSRAELNRALPCFCTLHTNEIPRIDPLVQVDHARVGDLDTGASKSDICAIRVVATSKRAGRTRACNRGWCRNGYGKHSVHSSSGGKLLKNYTKASPATCEKWLAYH
jgi:hypothetical protein